MSIKSDSNVRQASPKRAMALAAAVAMAAGPLATAWLAPAPALADEDAGLTDIASFSVGADEWPYFWKGAYHDFIGMCIQRGDEVVSEGFTVRGWYRFDGGSIDELVAQPTAPGPWMLVLDGVPALGFTGTLVDVVDVHDLSDLSCGNVTLADESDPYVSGGVFHGAEEPRIYMGDPTTGEEVYLFPGTDFEVLGWRRDAVASEEGLVPEPNAGGSWFLVCRGKGAYSGLCVGLISVDSINDLSAFRPFVTPITILNHDEDFREGFFASYLDEDEPFIPRLGLMHYNRDTGKLDLLREGEDFTVRGWTQDYDVDTGAIPSRLEAAPTMGGDWWVVLDGRGAYTGTAVVIYPVNDLSDIGNGGYQPERYPEAVAVERGGRALLSQSLVLTTYNMKDDCFFAIREGADFDIVEELGRGTDLNGRAVYRYRLRGKGRYHGELTVEVPVASSYDPDDWWEAVWEAGHEPTVGGDGFSGTEGLTLVRRDLDSGEEVVLRQGRDFEVTGWDLSGPGDRTGYEDWWLPEPYAWDKWLMRVEPVAGGALDKMRIVGTYVAKGEGAPAVKPERPLSRKGWYEEGGSWCYYESGRKATGWRSIGGVWYYFGGDGTMATGWRSLGGAWYYLDPSGAMATGWRQVGGAWYYLDPSGAMATGWRQVGGAWYYLQPSGAMATGWRQVGGAWYYLQPSGAMATGWQLVNGTWYYFHPSGTMAANEWVGSYWLDASGAWRG